MAAPRLGIYTAVYGGYDVPKPLPAKFDIPKTSRILLTDNLDIKAPSWTVVHAPELITQGVDNPPMMNAKRAKLFPHEVFGHTVDISLWVDASMTIVEPDYGARCLEALGDDDWTLVKHPGRNCIYDEATYSATLPRYADIAPAIRAQADYYRELGHPAHWGLFAAGAHVRRHTPAVRTVCGQWWWECATRTYQDQLSLPVLLRLAGHGVAWNTNMPWGTWWHVSDHAPR